MYNLLVVDDEPRHRRGIISMLKKIRPLYKVEEAKTGIEALTIVKSKHIDIVITDIKMPAMDGLSFIERLNKEGINVKVIILSGYAYFEYARKAMELGAQGYILKPVNSEKVHDVLLKVEQKIRQETEDNTQRVSLERQLEEAMPFYLRRRLNKWIIGEQEGHKIDIIKEIFSDSVTGFTALIKLSDINKIMLNSYPVISREIFKAFLDDIMLKHSDMDCFTFFQEPEDNIIIIIISRKEEENNNTKDIQLFEDVIEQFKNKFGIEIIVGKGTYFNNIINNASLSYKEAKEALEYSFYESYNNIILYKNIKEQIVRNRVLPEMSDMQEELKQKLLSSDTESTVKVLNSILYSMTSSGYYPPALFKEGVSHLLVNMVNHARHILDEKSIHKVLHKMRQTIKEAVSFNSMKKNISEQIEEFIYLLNEKNSAKTHNMISQCIEYMENHHMEDIPRDFISKRLGLNRNYFSSFFKKNTGMTYSEYLINIRIKHAKRLLKETDNKIYEVANKTGYKDVKYFNRVFKSKCGVTPDEYRKKIIRQGAMDEDI